jgi:hypothetical protein
LTRALKPHIHRVSTASALEVLQGCEDPTVDFDGKVVFRAAHVRFHSLFLFRIDRRWKRWHQVDVVYCGALPQDGLGICLKVTDGASRAAEVVMGQVLRHLGVIDDEMAETLSATLTPAVKNWAGTPTGQVRPAF